MTTASLLGTFAALELAQLTLTAVFLFLGARWARIPNVSFLRSVGATMVMYATGAAALVMVTVLEAFAAGWATLVMVVLAVGLLVLTWFIIAFMFKAKLWRAVLAWLPTLIAPAVFAVLALYVVRPYFFEAFKIPTNAIAPTILGVHWEAPCPRCGSPAFATPEPDQSRPLLHPVLMVCGREYRAVEVEDPPRVEFPGDRIVVNKLIAPRRWDLIAFSLPENPETKFCMRLVGLPGEKLVIRDGSIWIDGEKQTPPDEIANLEYLAKLDGFHDALWGSEAKPAQLGPDEYFVLGDFSARSRDSRLWELGAPGHPPYAVPASYIVGVVTHIYWPMSRWSVLR